MEMGPTFANLAGAWYKSLLCKACCKVVRHGSPTLSLSNSPRIINNNNSNNNNNN